MTGLLDPWYQAREAMRVALERDLLGDPTEEVIAEAPLNRMIAGILHPQGDGPVEETNVEEGATEGRSRAEDSTTDIPVALSRVRAPSSMGMTFAVDEGSTRELVFHFTAARYTSKASGKFNDDIDDAITRGSTADDGLEWHVTRVDPPPWVVLIDGPSPKPRELAPGLDVRLIIRRTTDGIVRVTVVLVNTHRHSGGRKDEMCWFRPSITVSVDGGSFVDRRPSGTLQVDDPDHTTNELLYRSVENLAVGHGCAVTWARDIPVTELRTTFLPSHELALAEPSGGDYLLEMDELGCGHGRDQLTSMVDDYRRWIDDRSTEIDQLEPQYHTTAHRHIEQARRAATRIEAGIQLLERDPTARRAFELMNLSMNEQRIRQEKIRKGDNTLSVPSQTWRPFQMAFILINLPGLSDATHNDREIVDLLWFPTGGGKTEAYLGAMAYSILLRRLRNPSDAGVSVIMRYTLRLLTLQQFERAATLVCALELLRRNKIPSSHPISLGLWVGQAATPNTVKDAATVLGKLKLGDPVEESNPRQLLKCPWCGASLSLNEYRVTAAKDKLTVRCSDPDCDFADALPVHVTDEDVYRERPSIVIGTVDKFAMMAWNAKVSALLSTDGANPPPDLIVQDELHLISGPLGTMVGLYESVVDLACTGVGRPKVIASTATIRRATKQVRAVFDRDAEQFPPPGLDARDMYFSCESDRGSKGTREYIGVFAPGASQSTLIVRTYAALLDAADTLADTPAKDAYWTLLGYFNSLRVLGGAYLQVVDDVPDRIKVLARRRKATPRRISGEPDELTSRKRSSEIPQAMKALETSYPDPKSPDVVLATNMISVGLDVERLGLMVVAGQPQSTAEYIQATSRVGRRHPGLVIVMYNAARSRDKSHYESFTPYHRALYREVEATTATPFAPRARDRGAHGVLVSAVRLLISGLRSDGAAGSIANHRAAVMEKVSTLVDRAKSVAPEQADAFEKQLLELVERWIDGAAHDVTPVEAYPGWRKTVGMLLVPAGGGEAESETMRFPVTAPPWPTLTSMRDVDATTFLQVKNRKRARNGR